MTFVGGSAIRDYLMRALWIALPLMITVVASCAPIDIPDGRTTQVPPIKPATDRFEGLNETHDPVTRVRLGKDVLMPQPIKEDPWPDVNVGPYELRNETLASALQLILDDYDVSLAFETDEGLRRRITVSNLRGKLGDVIHKVCAVADLYCHHENGALTIKRTETFVVDLPPINVVAAAASGSSTSSGSSSSSAATTGSTSSSSGSSTSSGSGSTTNDAYTQIAAGLTAVLATGDATAPATPPTIDTSTRVLIYSATQRSQKAALQYFERLRKNTALIIFETHIWEVTLNNDGQTGINWGSLAAAGISAASGNLNVTSSFIDSLPAGTSAATPITITPTYTGSNNLSASFILKFISAHGAVKTVSQPQITVLSGSQASLNISQQDNYVASTSTSAGNATTGAQSTSSVTPGTVNTGLTMNVTSAWDQSTVYGAVSINLSDLVRIDTFTNADNTSTIQLPHTTSRSLSTEIRVRPGDAILIGGLVSQRDSLVSSGPGFMTPLFATERTATKVNTELVFLLRPRVVAFVMGDDADTPKIVDAPKDGILPPLPPAGRKVTDVKSPSVSSQGVSLGATPLPTGLPVDALAPAASKPAAMAAPIALPAAMAPIPPSKKAETAPPVPMKLAPSKPAPAKSAPVDDMPASLQETSMPPAMVKPAEKNKDATKSTADYGGMNR